MGVGLTLPQMLQTLANSNVMWARKPLISAHNPPWSGELGSSSPWTILEYRSTCEWHARLCAIRNRIASYPSPCIAGQDGDDDVVEGTVLMRRGEASKETIDKVVEEVDYINTHDILPPGVKIERIYGRSDLIGKTTSTVLHNVIFGTSDSWAGVPWSAVTPPSGIWTGTSWSGERRGRGPPGRGPPGQGRPGRGRPGRGRPGPGPPGPGPRGPRSAGRREMVGSSPRFVAGYLGRALNRRVTGA